MSRNLARTTRREAVVEGRPIAYVLRRSRRRSIGFQVGEQGLVVAAPGWVALRDVDAAVQEKGRWIAARLAEAHARSERRSVARERLWRDGGAVSFVGATLRIALDEPDAGASAAPSAATIEGSGPTAHAMATTGHGTGASTPAPAIDADAAGHVDRLRLALPRDASPEQIRAAAERWLRAQALAVLAPRVRHFAERLGVRVTRLGVSTARTRWGSASASGAIRLHWRLVQLAPALIDYVVVHELAHLREMNHSPRFWAVVESVLPDHRERRLALREAALAID